MKNEPNQTTVSNDAADALGEAIVYALDDRAVHSLEFIGAEPAAPIAEGDGRCQMRIAGQFDMRHAGYELARQLVALGWTPPA